MEKLKLNLQELNVKSFETKSVRSKTGIADGDMKITITITITDKLDFPGGGATGFNCYFPGGDATGFNC